MWFFNSTLRILILSGFFAGTGSAQVCTEPGDIQPAKELLITDPNVVRSALANPGGPWHFSSLIRQMLPASDAEAANFVERWLRTFTKNQVLRPDPLRPIGPDNPERLLPARLDFGSLVIEPWKAQSLASGGESLDLDLAPFTLVAIVNRSDSRDPSRCASSAGEGRFVFAALQQPTKNPIAATTQDTLPFTVIFEYELPTMVFDAVTWASAWHALSEIPCQAGDCNDYLSQLKQITDSFSKRGLIPERPVGNPINQIRTNEIFSFPGDMREFHLKATTEGTELVNVVVKQTPSLSVNDSEHLASWALDHLRPILNGRHQLPGRFASFQAPTLIRTRWGFPNGSGLPPSDFENLRFSLSKATCNGCHSFESDRLPNVDGVYHIAPSGKVSSYLEDEELPIRAQLFCATLNTLTCTDTDAEFSLQARRGGH